MPKKETKILDEPSNVVLKDKSEETDRKNIKQLVDYKKHWEPRWYLSQAFYEGVHFTYPRKDSNGNWQRKNEVGKYKVIREIPKAKKQLDSIRNLILKLKQRPVVYPDTNVIIADKANDPKAQEQEKNNAELQARYIDYFLNEKMKLSRHKKKLIRYAELYHVSFIQILNDNGEKELAVYSPFEISIYPVISNINEYPMVAKHVSHRFEDLKGNDLYDQTVIAELDKEFKDGKYSNSVYLDSYMRERFGNAPDDNVIVDELYQIVKVKVDSEDNVVEDMELFEKEFEEAQGALPPEERSDDIGVEEKERVRVRAYIGDKKVRDEVTKLSKIPIAMFVWGDEAYATSLMEDLMPMNKAYDIFISKLEHKAKKMDTGRYLIQKGEDNKIITTNDGEFIRYKRFKPEVMQEANVNNAFMATVENIENDMKEMGVSMTGAAGLPTGVEAWRAIESLKEIDYESIGTQLDNLNECITDLTEKLVEMIAYDMTSEEQVQMKNEASGEVEGFNVIGKRGAEILEDQGGEVSSNTIVIDPNRTVTVEIESDMTWTKEGQRYMVLDMINAGILPKEMALETLKFGNTKDIVAKLMQEDTQGKSMIDMPDFQVLPRELKQEILQLLANGAPEGNEIIPNMDGKVAGGEQPQ